MKRLLSNERTAVFKRNKRRSRNFLTAFPPAERPSIPKHYSQFPSTTFDDQVGHGNDCQDDSAPSSSNQDEVDNRNRSVIQRDNSNDINLDRTHDEDEQNYNNEEHYFDIVTLDLLSRLYFPLGAFLGAEGNSYKC